MFVDVHNAPSQTTDVGEAADVVCLLPDGRRGVYVCMKRIAKDFRAIDGYWRPIVSSYVAFQFGVGVDIVNEGCTNVKTQRQEFHCGTQTTVISRNKLYITTRLMLLSVLTYYTRPPPPVRRRMTTCIILACIALPHQDA